MSVSFPAQNTKKKPLNRVAFFAYDLRNTDLGVFFRFCEKLLKARVIQYEQVQD